MLSVSDAELGFFKHDVTQLTEIENEIKELKKKMKPIQEKIKELTAIKKQKTTEVLSFMETNELDNCNTDNGTLEMKDCKKTKTVSKGDVYDRLLKYFETDEDKSNTGSSEERARKLHNYIYVEGRETTIEKTLKTTLN